MGMGEEKKMEIENANEAIRKDWKYFWPDPWEDADKNKESWSNKKRLKD